MNTSAASAIEDTLLRFASCLYWLSCVPSTDDADTAAKLRAHHVVEATRRHAAALRAC